MVINEVFSQVSVTFVFSNVLNINIAPVKNIYNISEIIYQVAKLLWIEF